VRIAESVEIQRPIEAVWALVSDRQNDPSWCAKVKSVGVSGEGHWVEIHKPVPLRPALPLSVVEVGRRAPNWLTLRQEDETSVFEIEYTLEPAGDGTRFSQVSEFEWKKLPRVLHRTFARGVRNDVRAQLRSLKKLLEES
jgi:carbon monoxide dehydrogenase subunit G